MGRMMSSFSLRLDLAHRAAEHQFAPPTTTVPVYTTCATGWIYDVHHITVCLHSKSTDSYRTIRKTHSGHQLELATPTFKPKLAHSQRCIYVCKYSCTEPTDSLALSR